MKVVGEVILYTLAYCLALSLPFSLKYFIACRIADLFYVFLPARRMIVWNNLKIITGKNKRETLPQVRKVYYHFACFVAEFLSLPLITKKRIERWVEIVHPEYLKEAFSKRRGTICLTAHIGNWEWGGACLSMLGYPMNAIILPQKNPWIARLFLKLRESSGMRVINVGGGAKRSIKVLKEGEGLAILGDRPFGEEGVKVRFCGKKSIFPKGPVYFAYHTGAAILPGFTVKEKGRYYLYLEKPFYIERGKDKEKVIAEGVQKIASLIEKYVKRFPTQWSVFEDIWE
ncbi:lysophospholipid acyltransferase family protein [Candidatus Calescamantes bacterium]|nr:lysophospholipid acyltransferase family protein [Candidatus Calescamantes bacterium]